MGQRTSALSHAEKGKHLTFLCVSQSYQHLPFHHLGQQIFPNLRVKQKSLTHKQSRYSNITFWILLAPGGLVAESTEGSYLAPLLSFLSAQKGWQGVACQGRLPTAEISCTAVEINNYWACLVPITPFPWLCFALCSWSILLCHLLVQGGTWDRRVHSWSFPSLLLCPCLFLEGHRSHVWDVWCCMASGPLSWYAGLFLVWPAQNHKSYGLATYMGPHNARDGLSHVILTN